MSTILLYGLGSVAVVGILMLLIGKFAGRRKSLFSIFKKKQKVHTEEIKEIHASQAQVWVRIKNADKVSVETKREIQEKVVKANKEVDEILKEESMANLSNTLNEEW